MHNKLKKMVKFTFFYICPSNYNTQDYRKFCLLIIAKLLAERPKYRRSYELYKFKPDCNHHFKTSINKRRSHSCCSQAFYGHTEFRRHEKLSYPVCVSFERRTTGKEGHSESNCRRSSWKSDMHIKSNG